MKNRKLLLHRILALMLILHFSMPVSGQRQKSQPNSWDNNWKMDLKVGTGILLTPVPDKYLDRINNINIPLSEPGLATFLTIRKSFTRHLEFGYQIDYISIHDNMTRGNGTYKVKTKALESNFLVLYNFRTAEQAKNRFNYLVYYKIGAIALKNEPLQRMEDGTFVTPSFASSGSGFLKNAAVLTGLGFGFTKPLNKNFRLITTIELNRSADVVGDIYKIHKLFYHSENTVSSFILGGAGINYTFGFESKKKTAERQRSSKNIWKPKKSKSSGRSSSSVDDRMIWYKHKKGK